MEAEAPPCGGDVPAPACPWSGCGLLPLREHKTKVRTVWAGNGSPVPKGREAPYDASREGRHHENLIDDTFEAWVQGAVQPHLYQEYRMYGFQYIPKELDARGIPEEFLSFAREIYESYGDLDGDELERLNHTERPWLNARKGLKPWQGSNNIISEEDMKIYYRKLMENEE